MLDLLTRDLSGTVRETLICLGSFGRPCNLLLIKLDFVKAGWIEMLAMWKWEHW